MKWLLAPLDRHSDDGFGATATAFRHGAEAILGLEKPKSFDHAYLPGCFLLRHAAELFLKSALIVLHRRFAGEGADPVPTIVVRGKAKPLTKVHELEGLYAALQERLETNRAEMEAVCSTPWYPTPPELDAAIAAIQEVDPGSFYFRYPSLSSVEDEEKSEFKRMAPDELEGWDSEKRGLLKAFFVVDRNDEVVEAFRYEPGSKLQEIEHLKAACEWLNCYHVGLRMELADGW